MKTAISGIFSGDGRLVEGCQCEVVFGIRKSQNCENYLLGSRCNFGAGGARSHPRACLWTNSPIRGDGGMGFRSSSTGGRNLFKKNKNKKQSPGGRSLRGPMVPGAWVPPGAGGRGAVCQERGGQSFHGLVFTLESSLVTKTPMVGGAG